MSVVSVVIPFRGRVDWLLAAIDSVLRQTFQDFEVIVVDDGSLEAPALDLLLDHRVRYVRQERRGASAARNRGIALANGKYVAFLDADDLFHSEKLQVQVAVMEANPQHVLSHTSYSRIDAMGTYVEDVASGSFTGAVYPSIVTSCPIATPTVMVRRDALLAGDLRFDESVDRGEDVIMWVDIARRAGVLGIDRSLSSVRMHGANAALDPSSQFSAGIVILKHAFRSDRSFGLVFRRRAMARVSLHAGNLFAAQGERFSALKCVARSVTYWPLSRGSLRLLLLLLLPTPIRAALREMRDRRTDARDQDGRPVTACHTPHR